MSKTHAQITEGQMVEVDELYFKAVDVVRKEGKVSTSFIQRDLKIGYNRAACIIEDMEKNGVISEPSPTGKRTVMKKESEKSEADAIIDKEANRVAEENSLNPEIPGIGHNDGEPMDTGGVANQRLKSFIERVERLEEEKAALMEDIKEVYAELKGVGFDVKVCRKIVSLRKMDTEKRREEEELLDLYKAAVGML